MVFLLFLFIRHTGFLGRFLKRLVTGLLRGP